MLKTSTSYGLTVWRTCESSVFGRKLYGIITSKTGFHFIILFSTPAEQCWIWTNEGAGLPVVWMHAAKTLLSAVCIQWVCLSFFYFRCACVCVSTSILTMLYCWLHVCFPQAAVRGQKGEKGDPAVLEPVSDWLSLSSFTWAGVFKMAPSVTRRE